MSDMPERIWAQGREGVDTSLWYSGSVGDDVCYIRADVHQAEVERLQERLLRMGRDLELMANEKGYGEDSTYPVKPE